MFGNNTVVNKISVIKPCQHQLRRAAGLVSNHATIGGDMKGTARGGVPPAPWRLAYPASFWKTCKAGSSRITEAALAISCSSGPAASFGPAPYADKALRPA